MAGHHASGLRGVLLRHDHSASRSGIQHLKLAGLSLAPIGKTVVSVELADEARKQDAENKLAEIREGIVFCY